MFCRVSGQCGIVTRCQRRREAPIITVSTTARSAHYYHATSGKNCSRAVLVPHKHSQYDTYVDFRVEHETMASEIGKLHTTAAMVPHPRLRGVETLPNILSYKAALLKLDYPRRPLDGGGRHGRKGVFGTQFSLQKCVPNTHFGPWRPPPSNGCLELSSFNDAALSNSMLGNVSTPRSRGWGTMAAVVRSFPISDAMV